MFYTGNIAKLVLQFNGSSFSPMKFKKCFYALSSALLLCSVSQKVLFAQARLVIGTTSAVYMNINGGTVGTPIYLVIDNGASNAIWSQPANAVFPTPSSAAGTSYIISEGQYNYVTWRQITTGNTYTIPFGIVAGAAAYLPVSLAKTVGAAADLVVSTWGTPSNNTPWAGISDAGAVAAVNTMQNVGNADGSIGFVIDRWWTIYSAGMNANNIYFTYRGSENTMTTPTDGLSIQHWDGSKWNDGNGGAAGTNVNTGAAGSNAAGPHSVTAGAAAFTQFAPYILVSQPHPLPVEWLRESAECNHKEITIKWTTASEQNSNFFTVERSLDGINFSAITTVWAAGNSSSIKNYSAVDTDPYSGTSYYRVRETDFNGSSMTTNLMTVTGCSNDDVIIYGSQGYLSVIINALDDEQYTIELYDVLGQKLLNEIKSVSSGNNYLKLPVSNIASAIYIARVYNSRNAVTKKVFIRSAYSQ